MQNLTTQVSILTARGMSAIASVALAGTEAKEILSKVFCAKKSGSNGIASLQAGQIVHGSIVDGDRVIDEVVVAAEADDLLTIHCHGNPLLTEQIVKLLQARGAVLVDARKFAAGLLELQSAGMIEAEAKLAAAQSATLTGAKILHSQIDAGLSLWARDLLAKIDTADPGEVKLQCKQILDRSRIAERIIHGVKIVIAGPPNSGKSTLLNCLAGQQEVIISDTAGTTRDWVSTSCRIGPLYAEFIDTAGLDDVLAARDDLEQAAQQMTQDLLAAADLVLHVVDVSERRTQKAEYSIQIDKPVIEVSNKWDLVQEYKHSGTLELKGVCISAAEGTGIEMLTAAILRTLKVDDFPVDEAIVFTPRQQTIMQLIIECDDKTSVQAVLAGLFGE